MHLEILLSLSSFDIVETVAKIEIDVNAMEEDSLQL